MDVRCPACNAQVDTTGSCIGCSIIADLVEQNCFENRIRKREKEVLSNWHWPYLRVNSNGAKEYECPHGVGHGGIHGCDGCCQHKSYKERVKE